jgi:SAM-dependent methyltransferase
MNSGELSLLGWELMRISDKALPEGSKLRQLEPAARLMVTDVVQHSGTSVGEIADRTGLPRNQVSLLKSWLAKEGFLEVDPADGQRITASSGLPLEAATQPIDKAIAAALGTQDVGQVGELVATLESLVRRIDVGELRPASKGHDATSWRGRVWETGRPQPVFAELAEAGAIRGRVLDVGCGTGEHALMAVGLGLPALGVDISSNAIEIAIRRAKERDLSARFAVHDALDLGALAEQFDTVLDCGLFHNFNDEERPHYTESLRSVVPPGGRFFMLCFSDLMPPGFRPRRVTQQEIESTFAEGWRIDALERATMEAQGNAGIRKGIQTWHASITRI